MEEHEKALISRQFIEVMLKVPVILCPGRIEAIETGIKEYFPDFIKNSFPFFITRSMAESLQTGTLYHITDFINLHFNLFLYGGGTQLLIAGPYLSHPADTSFCEQILQDNGKNLSLLVPFSQFCLSLPVVGSSQMLEVMRTAMRVITGTDREIPYLHYEPQRHYTQEISNLSAEGVDEASMELLEHRYYYEKLLLQEVAQGSQDLALKYYRQFSQESRSIVRTEDPLRTAKNLSLSYTRFCDSSSRFPIFIYAKSA